MIIIKKIVVGLAFGLAVAGSAVAGIYDDILMAADKNDTATVIDLLRRGMDVNTTDPSGNTLLILAARAGNIELVDFLVRNRANLQKRNRFGDTALMLAAYQGHAPVLRRLLDMGADPNLPGWAPLHYAAHAGQLDAARELVAHKADLEAVAPNGQTALMLAASTGRLEIVRVLIAAGAKADAADYDGKTALDAAEKNNHAEVAQVLRAAAQK